MLTPRLQRQRKPIPVQVVVGYIFRDPATGGGPAPDIDKLGDGFLAAIEEQNLLFMGKFGTAWYTPNPNNNYDLEDPLDIESIAQDLETLS